MNYRLEELNKFDVSKKDFEEILGLCKKAETVQELRKTFRLVMGYLTPEEGESIGSRLWESAKALSLLEKNPEMKCLSDEMADIANRVDVLCEQILEKASTFELDEETLDQAQSRLFQYQDLFRKHSVSNIDSLMDVFSSLKGELERGEHFASRVEIQLQELSDKTVHLSELAKNLSKARSSAIKLVTKQVERELSELAMRGARFEVEILPSARSLPQLSLESLGERSVKLWENSAKILCTLLPEGSERAHFLLASNTGEKCLPLISVASGGELSRIMLALKKAITAEAQTCVLVFDEIDSGISGRVADIVGKKMQELSQNFQVICVSHLPQVGVYADTHFVVRKRGRNHRTESSILRLSNEESVLEIARLLSGAALSSTSIANAKNLIRKAKSCTGVRPNP